MTRKGLGDAAYGFRIPDGEASLDELPWTNLDRISIRFDRPASITAAGLTVLGVRVPSYAISNFRYDSATNTAVWTLSNAVGADRLRLGLAGGEILTSRLNVLPSDVNRDGSTINASDLVIVRNRVGTTATAPGSGQNIYTPFADVNGDGAVNASDLVLVRNRIGTALPPEHAGNAAWFSVQRISTDKHEDDSEELLDASV